MLSRIKNHIPGDLKKEREVALASLQSALKLAKECLNGMPVPAAQGVIGAILIIIETCDVSFRTWSRKDSLLMTLQKSAQNSQTIRDLQTRVESLNNAVIEPLRAVKDPQNLGPLQKAVDDLVRYVHCYTRQALL